MVAVRGKPHGGPIVVQVFRSDGARAVGKDDVVLRETLFGCQWVGDQEDVAHAKFEEQDGAVLLREVVQGEVKWFFE